MAKAVREDVENVFISVPKKGGMETNTNSIADTGFEELPSSAAFGELDGTGETYTTVSKDIYKEVARLIGGRALYKASIHPKLLEMLRTPGERAAVNLILGTLNNSAALLNRVLAKTYSETNNICTECNKALSEERRQVPTRHIMGHSITPKMPGGIRIVDAECNLCQISLDQDSDDIPSVVISSGQRKSASMRFFWNENTRWYLLGTCEDTWMLHRVNYVSGMRFAWTTQNPH